MSEKNDSSEYIQIFTLQIKTIKIKIMNIFISLSLTLTIITKNNFILWFFK